VNLPPEGSRSAKDATAWLASAGVTDAAPFIGRIRRKSPVGSRSSIRVPYDSASVHAGMIVQVGHYSGAWYIRRID
jgi:hypothetical protein